MSSHPSGKPEGKPQRGTGAKIRIIRETAKKNQKKFRTRENSSSG